MVSPITVATMKLRTECGQSKIMKGKQLDKTLRKSNSCLSPPRVKGVTNLLYSMGKKNFY